MNLIYPPEPIYTLNDNRELTQINQVKRLLDLSYWAPDRDLAMIQRSIEHSLVFNVLYNNTQIGFARVITDRCTFGYLSDVIIDPDHRGKGIGSWLLRSILTHPQIRDCLKLMLTTQDAHSLYRSIGFEITLQPENVMERFHG